MQTPLTKAIEKIKLKSKDTPTNNALNRRTKGAYVDCIVYLQSLLPYEQECIENAVNETEKKCVIFGNKIINKFSKKAGDLFCHEKDAGNIYFYQTFNNECPTS